MGDIRIMIKGTDQGRVGREPIQRGTEGGGRRREPMGDIRVMIKGTEGREPIQHGEARTRTEGRREGREGEAGRRKGHGQEREPKQDGREGGRKGREPIQHGEAREGRQVDKRLPM
jgi:hypothetical protein